MLSGDSEGSKFCPYCGAEQTAMPDAGNVNEQPESTVQPEVNAQEAEPQQEEAVQTSTPVQQETNTQYQDSYSAGNQGAYSYGNSSQNDNYQNNTYQNGNYQNMPPYQQNQGRYGELGSVSGTVDHIHPLLLYPIWYRCYRIFC